MSKSLFAAIVAIAAQHAVSEKRTQAQATKALVDAMKGVKSTPKLPKGWRMDEFGGIWITGEGDAAVFSPDNALYATTPQQLANIRVQVGMNDAGECVPSGPGFQGWAQGQVANEFKVPLQRLVGYTESGTPQFEPADKSGAWLYSRLRVRGRGQVVIDQLRAYNAQRQG